MLTKYDGFVMLLRDTIHQFTEIELNNITFCRDERNAWKDRLHIVCAENGELKQLCSLHTKELYEYHKKGMSMEDIIMPTVESIQHLREEGIFDKVLNMENYEEVRDDLFVRLLNYEKNKKELENAVYRKIGDIALVLYLKIEEREGCLTSMKMYKTITDKWPLSEEEYFEHALLNTYFQSPPRIFTFEQLLMDPEYEGENFMNICSDFKINTAQMGNCLSTAKKTNGAIAIFLPGVARRIGQLLDEDFFIVFTSVHEAMIHSDQVVDAENLRHILRDTIREGTPEEDFLTYRIYHYERKTGEFTVL